jgi:hypothetical protein
MSRLICTVGLQGSGKSTWAREFLKQRAGELLGACFAAYDGKNYEAVIWKGLRPARAVSYKEMPAEAE